MRPLGVVAKRDVFPPALRTQHRPAARRRWNAHERRHLGLKPALRQGGDHALALPPRIESFAHVLRGAAPAGAEVAAHRRHAIRAGSGQQVGQALDIGAHRLARQGKGNEAPLRSGKGNAVALCAKAGYLQGLRADHVRAPAHNGPRSPGRGSRRIGPLADM